MQDEDSYIGGGARFGARQAEFEVGARIDSRFQRKRIMY